VCDRRCGQPDRRIHHHLFTPEPTNGYDLTLRIQAVSNDVLNVNACSLYPALYRLEAKGLIQAEWANTETDGTAKVTMGRSARPPRRADSPLHMHRLPM